MQRFRVAVSTRTWDGPLRDVVRNAVATGATGIQLDVRDELPPGALTQTGRRDFLHFLREAGLSVASTVFPMKHPLASDHELDRRLAALRTAMEHTYQLGANTLCLRVGKLPDEANAKEAQVLHEVLSDLAQHGNHVGVTLALTPSNDSAERLRDGVTRITTGYVGIDFDPAHFVQNGQSTSAALRTLHGTVQHVQLRDGVRDLSGGGQETAFGQGAVDWVELFALLGEMDYSGWLTAIRQTGDDRPQDVARAVAQVKRMLFLA
jgi:sugar phosphate isomerase/epimerase